VPGAQLAYRNRRRLPLGITRTRSFDLEDQGPVVKLTVLHDGFDADSAMLPDISEGWPRIMADLKTLLETGDLAAAS
jgi:hypothetical protein